MKLLRSSLCTITSVSQQNFIAVVDGGAAREFQKSQIPPSQQHLIVPSAIFELNLYRNDEIIVREFKFG